jgi:small-conductance mechanosensitive channel
MVDLQTLDYQNILYSPLFSKIVVTVIILIIGIIVGKTIGKVLYRVLHELGLNKLIKDTTKIKISLEKIISNFIASFIYFITVIMALTQLGISTTVLNILIIAIVVIIIIAIVFIVKDFFPNIIAGMFIQHKNFIKGGDFIKVNDKEGEVTKINIIETTIKTKKGDIIYIPNSLLFKKEITILKQ